MVKLLTILFPKFCVGCGRVGQYFCASCKTKIRHIEINEMICPVCEHGAIDGLTHPRCRTRYTLDGLITVFHYDNIIKQAIKEIKYRFVHDIVADLVLLMNHDVIVRIWKLHASFTDLALLPIPINTARKRYRGFNQSVLLARHAVASFGVPVADTMIIRIRQTIPQVEMKNREERLHNMQKVFSINPTYKQSIPEAILLIDDVFTTGATLASAARVLKCAGAKHVFGFTLAR